MLKRTLLIAICVFFNVQILPGGYAEDVADSITTARAYQSKGDYNSALKELRKSEDVSSMDAKGRKALSDAYIALSGEALNKASRKIALAITESAIKAFPDDKRIIIKHGKAQLAVGKYEEAVNATGKFLSLEGGQGNDPEASALGSVAQGFALETNKIENNFTLKIKNYEKAISADPEWFLPYLLLGAAYVPEKDYSKAEEYFEKGLSLNPRGFSHMDYILLSSIYNERKLYQKVKDLLHNVPSEHPYWPGVHLYLGYAEEGLGDPLGALYQYNYELFISGPDNFFFQPAQQAMIHIIQEISANKAMQEKYPELDNFVRAGRAGANKEFKQSIEYYSKVESSNDSPSPILFLLLGEAYMQNKDYDKAIDYLKKVVLMDPAFPPAYCEIGDMYAEKGDMDNAVLWWEKGFATDPVNWKVKMTKERLKSTKINVGKFSEFLKNNNIE